jgi:hypothetical protein
LAERRDRQQRADPSCLVSFFGHLLIRRLRSAKGFAQIRFF